MSKEKVFIRADGGPEIGLGHIVRCIALAQMLEEEFEITFYSKELPEKLSREMKNKGFKLVIIQSEYEFYKSLDGKQIVVLDHYGLDSEYQKKIKATGCKLVCIDDLHDKEFFADLIINHSPGISPKNYHAQPYTQFALGMDYSLLRETFIEAAKKNRKIKKYSSALICFGGSDPANLTKKVLESIIPLKYFSSVTVVTGSSYTNLESLELLVKDISSVSILKSLDEKGMLTAMLSADIAIVSASGTVMEVIASGTVPMIGYSAPNQKNLFSFFRDNSSILSFDGINFDKGSFERTIERIDIRENHSDLQKFRNQIKASAKNHRLIFKSLSNG